MSLTNHETAQTNNSSSLDESIVLKRDPSGNLVQKLNSDLSESFMVVDKCVPIDNLTKREQTSIKEQDNLHNYNNLWNYKSTASGIYNIASYALTLKNMLFIL